MEKETASGGVKSRKKERKRDDVSKKRKKALRVLVLFKEESDLKRKYGRHC